MNIKRILTSIVVAVVATTSVMAQDGNNTMFLLPNSAIRYTLNPAYQPEFKSVVSIPALGGMGVNLFNNAVGADQILVNKSTPYGDSLLLDINKLRSKMPDDFRMNFNTDLNLLSVAFKTGKKGYSSISLGMKIDAGFGFGKDLINFLAEGNAPYIGTTQSLGDIMADATIYTEAALGYSRKINDKLTVGGRLKLLFGIMELHSKKAELAVTTPEGAEYLNLQANVEIYGSLPLANLPVGKVDFDSDFDDVEFDGDLMMDFTKNIGFGLDLGATYHLNDDWTFGASVNDLGFINWKSNIYKAVSDSEFKWEGADVSNSINKNDPEYVEVGDAFENLLDSLVDSFELTAVNNESYSKMLNAKVNLYATYHFHDKVNFSALVRGMKMADKFYPSMTISANTRPLKNLGISVTYSAYKGNAANIGIGIVPRFGAFQPYLVVDNVLAGNFTHTKGASFRFGINFVGKALYGKAAKKRGTAQKWRAI